MYCLGLFVDADREVEVIHTFDVGALRFDCFRHRIGPLVITPSLALF